MFVKITNREAALNAYLDTVLKAKKLPTSISNLNAGLTNVDTNAFSHAGRYVLKYQLLNINYNLNCFGSLPRNYSLFTCRIYDSS